MKRTKPPKGKKVGRKSKFSEEMLEWIRKFAQMGMTDMQIASFLEINISTFDVWKKDKPEVWEALQKGRVYANAEVAECLYNNARGYYYYEENAVVSKGQVIRYTLKKYKPSESFAALKILTIRDRENWADTQNLKHEHHHSGTVHHKKVEDLVEQNVLDDEEQRLIFSINQKQLLENSNGSN